MKCPFDIIYLTNSCEAISNSFFLQSNGQSTDDIVSADLNICFLNFDGNYEKVIICTKISKIKQVTFKHVNHILQEMDRNYPFYMPGQLSIIICGLGAIV